MRQSVLCNTQNHTNQPTNQQTNKQTNKQTNQPSKQPTNKPSNQPTKQPTNQSTNQPTKQPKLSELFHFTDTSSQVKWIINSTEFCDIRYKPNGYFEWGHHSGTLKPLSEVESSFSRVYLKPHSTSVQAGAKPWRYLRNSQIYLVLVIRCTLSSSPKPGISLDPSALPSTRARWLIKQENEFK